MRPLHPAQLVDVLAVAHAVTIAHAADSNHADYQKIPCTTSGLLLPGDSVSGVDNTPSTIAPEA